MSRFRPTVAQRLQRWGYAVALSLPDRVRRWCDRHPHIVDGHRLDPDTHIGLSLMRKFGAVYPHQLSVAKARQHMAADMWMFAGRISPVDSSTDLQIPGPGGAIPARLHRPRGGDEPLGVLINFHGGGWVLGDIDGHDPTCRFLCAAGGFAVLNVDYRLAPEQPFPAAVDDAIAAYRWVRENAARLGLDPDRIGVGGDSAGGNLAAVVCQQAKTAGLPLPTVQFLGVPVTEIGSRTASRTTFADGYFLTLNDMDWYEEHYLAGADRTDVRASPLLADDLAGLSPAYVAVAGFDPLRDEGIAYAERLSRAGVPVTLRVHDDATHPMLTQASTALGKRVLKETAAELAKSLNPEWSGTRRYRAWPEQQHSKTFCGAG